MTLAGSWYRMAGPLGASSAALLAGCVLDLHGTGTSDSPQAVTLDAGVAREDARAQQPTDACVGVRQLALTPRAPSVLVLLDHSSSMFEYGFWEPVKANVLEAVNGFERDVRFGLATYTGERNGQCPALRVSAELAQNNAAALGRAYAGLVEPPYKGETPTAAALAQVADLLADDPQPGAKFIVLVTDGDPDFCDDGRTACAQDAVVAAVQAAYARGITTFAFRVGGQVAAEHLTDVANAGSGQPVAAREREDDDDCPASGARYAPAGGDAQFYDALAAGPEAPNALSTLVASLRSCVFDLQESPALGATALGALGVELDRRPIARDEPDGFRMNAAAELELLGASCRRWREPDASIAFTLPCP